MVKYESFTLDNGLRLVCNYDASSALAVVNVLYNTGARDEHPQLTGIAHLFEHLMFGGSVHVPEFDAVLELAGGQSNAATSADFTYFYDQLPVQNVETAFYLESDRMLSLSFSDKALQVQRAVVVEEFKQTCLNRPYGKVMHTLRPLIYDAAHPYSWPVIGKEPAHIEGVTQQNVKDWFASHYAPNNAILSVAGGIEPSRALELARKWFGPIPARSIAPRPVMVGDDAWPTQEKRVVVKDNVPQTAIYIAYRMPPYGEEGYDAADAITDILSAGKSTRLFQRLMLATDIFASADAFITASEHSGLLIFTARLNESSDRAIDRAVEMLKAEARQLAVPGNVTQYELDRAKNKFESVFTLENTNLVNLARTLAIAQYHGEDINSTVPRYRRLTLADIARTAQRIFIDHAPAIAIFKNE